MIIQNCGKRSRDSNTDYEETEVTALVIKRVTAGVERAEVTQTNAGATARE